MRDDDTGACSARRRGTRSRSASSTRPTAATIASASPPPAIQSAGKPVTFRVDAGPMLMGDEEPPGRLLRRARPTSRPSSSSSITWSRGTTIRILALRTGRRPDRAQDRRRQVRGAGPGGAVGRGRRAAARHLAAGEPSPHLRRPAAEARADLQQPQPRRGRLEGPRGRCRAHPARLRPPRLSPRRDRRRRQAVRRPREGASSPRSTRSSRRSASASRRSWSRPTSCSSARSRASSTTSPWPAGCRTSSGARCPTTSCSTLAEQGKLAQPATLRAQVERMLKHPKAAAFTENFVGQWLGLRDIDSTEPSHLLYPEFDAHAEGVDDPRDGAVLRRGAEERPEPDELRRLRLHDAQRPAGEALRHPRRGRAGSSAR